MTFLTFCRLGSRTRALHNINGFMNELGQRRSFTFYKTETPWCNAFDDASFNLHNRELV